MRKVTRSRLTMKYPPYPHANESSVRIIRTRNSNVFTIFDEIITHKTQNQIRETETAFTDFYHGRIRAGKIRGVWIGAYETRGPTLKDNEQLRNTMYQYFMQPPIGTHRIFKRRLRKVTSYSTGLKRHPVSVYEQWATIGPCLHVCDEKIIKFTFRIKDKEIDLRKDLYTDSGYWANSMIEYIAQEAKATGSLKLMEAL